jgi:hypothetical protein
MKIFVLGHLAVAAILAIALGSAAFAQHGAAAAPSSSANLQGGDSQAWMQDPHVHAFYDLSVATLGHGAANPDVEAYEQKAYAIFRDFGASKGMKPEAMQDHLKLIPRQMVKIAKDDPKVLDSYDNFTAALFGPP